MTAGTVTVDTTGELIYEASEDGDSGATSYFLKASGAALINIPGLHKEGEFFPIADGDSQVFRLNDLGIKEIFAKGDGGESVISGGIVAKTGL